jgi:gamma-glutamyl-gamma-aminobutyraldehyde dehydrogenase/4-guanidinobutyraldehyde dehydrogenase/NAD-dependent aldehyde dehydrogenase
VFEDAPDLDEVADGVVARMFFNQGQVCTAGSRLIVHRGLRKTLLEKIGNRVAAIEVGDPLDPRTTFGPLVGQIQHDKVMGYIARAVAHGTALHCGGRSLLQDRGGFYIEPTIFTDVDPRSQLAQEEIFGPVLAVMEFDTLDEAISLGNQSEYGLAATCWTRSLGVAQRLIRELNAGEIVLRGRGDMVGGATIAAMPLEPHRQSGMGVENGLEGLMAYTSLKSVQMFAA